jgi:hypothetical protein
MANISPGLNPSVLVAPDYQTQMMMAQRRLEMAQALQQQSLQDTPGNGGAVSWTQGLARALEGYVGGSMQRKAYQQMQGANQSYAAGLRSLFGGSPMGQGAQPASQGSPMPPQAQQAPQGPLPTDPNGIPQASPSISATAQGQPVAPPQAAPPPPSAPQQAPMGGASNSMSLTGDPNRDMMLYMMNPDEYTKQLAGVAAKSATPTDTEILMSHAHQLAAQGDYQGAAMLQAQAQKAGYVAPISGRPGGVILDPHTLKPIFQTPKIGENQAVTFDEQGHPSRVYNIPGATDAAAAQAAAVAGGQAAGKAPYDVVQGFQNGQPTWQPKAAVTGGVLNGHYYQPGNALPSGPTLGESSAADAYGKGNAQAFLETQGIAKESPQRVQALREMQSLISGHGALNTGPTAAKLQQVAEEHGLTFLAKDNAFVFNKDAARFVAQSASDLGLNGSDARLGMMANASPNMKMTPQALNTVIPTMIGLEYAKMAKATAASAWAQRDPAGNAKFETTWRQAYDPRMFTAYAQGGPQALAKAPANVRQQWLKDYRTLKGMGVDFTQFAQ